MANPILGAILGTVFANAMRGRARSGPFARAPAATGGGGLGDLLGGMMGRGAAAAPGSTAATRSGLGGGRGALLAMMLPLAMQWVQRNGGVGAVLERFKQKGYGQQANSWISTGPNQALTAEAMDEVVGGTELSEFSHRLGVPEREVALGFADILPEVVDQLTPDGQLAPETDEALNAGLREVEQELSHLTTSAPV